MIVFTKDDQAALDEVFARLKNREVNEQLFKQLKTLTEKQAAAEKAREEEVGKMMKALAGLNLSFPEFMKAQGENPIFPPSAIMAYAAEKAWRFPMSSKEHGDEPKKERKQRAKPTGVLFAIQPPKGRGAPYNITMTKAVPEDTEVPGDKVMWLLEQPGDIKANLMALQVPSEEAKVFLDSAEGKKRLAAWVDWMKKHAPQPTAKQSAKAPAQAQA